MPPDLEPAGALTERVYMLYGSPRAAQLIESDRAAVREPLERRVRELETELDLAQRFAHGEGEGRKSWRNRATAARWIPVEERMPEPTETVLVWPNLDTPLAAYVDIHGTWWSAVGDEDESALFGVTHWQALPEPPPSAQKEPHGR